MGIIYLSEKLFLLLSFFSLTTISLSFATEEEKEPVVFIGESLNTLTNKPYLYIIINSSLFNGSGTYEFKLESYEELEYYSFMYKFYINNFTNYTYDYLNSLSNYNSVYYIEQRISSVSHYYTMNFDFEDKNFQYFIIKIHIKSGKINIKTSNISVVNSNVLDTIFGILIMILPLCFIACCIYGCCYCCRPMARSRYSNNNLFNIEPEPCVAPQGPFINPVYPNNVQGGYYYNPTW